MAQLSLLLLLPSEKGIPALVLGDEPCHLQGQSLLPCRGVEFEPLPQCSAKTSNDVAHYDGVFVVL